MIGHVHTSDGVRVHLGVSATTDATLAAFDEAIAAGLPVRVHFGAGADLGVFRHLSALALSYCAVEARWEFPPALLGVADLFMIAPASGGDGARSFARSAPSLSPVTDGASTAVVPPSATAVGSTCTEVHP